MRGGALLCDAVGLVRSFILSVIVVMIYIKVKKACEGCGKMNLLFGEMRIEFV
jgi:hypothetical protein